MSTQDELAPLEAEHRQLLLSLRLPDTVVQRGAPELFKHFDMTFARQLLGGDEPWGREDAFAESGRIVRDILLASPEARRLHLASEIDLLRQVRETGEDQIHKGPFGLLEAVFPVRVRGHLVHLLRSGKYRVAPFEATELKDLAFLSGRPLTLVEEVAATVPVRGKDEADVALAGLRRLRDAASLALKEHMKARALVGQQLQNERLASLGTLADGMAHHFSNLLSVILGYTSLALDKGHLDVESAEALAKVAEAAQRGRSFTAEILALTGSEDEEETRVAVHERLDGVLGLLQSRQPPGLRIEREFAASRDTVLAPPGVLHQLVFNLLSATFDSLPRGATLSVRTANVSEHRELGAQDCLRIEVADRDAAAQPGRVTSSRTALDTMAGETVGPRLTSLFGQIGRLDGTVTVESAEDGRATRVEVTLPVAGPGEQAAEKRIRRRLAPSRIWVIDDDPTVCEMCRRVLSTEGHAVEALHSGEALIQRLQKESARPDLFLLDFSMPDQNGLEVINWLREAGHRTPVIFITAFGSDHPPIARALKHRKAFLLRKPFTFRDLADQVTIALGDTLIGA